MENTQKDKNRLWSALLKSEREARHRAFEKSQVEYFRIAPEGMHALRMLNRTLEKPEVTKIKKYSSEDLDRAFPIVESDSFRQKLVDSYVEEIARQQSLENEEPPCDPPEFAESSRQDQPEYIQKLWEKLEKMGIEVHELFDYGDGLIGFKISTALASYLDVGTAKDILDLAREDLRIVERAQCPFCHARIDYSSSDSHGHLLCPSCRAFGSFIPENMASEAVEIVHDHFGPDWILALLEEWDRLYAFDFEAQCSWLDFGCLGAEMEPKPLAVTGPALDDIQSELQLPIFVDREFGPEEERVLPSCAFCRYRGVVPDQRDIVLGVESTYSSFWESHICLYPHTQEALFVEGLLELRAEKQRGYQKIHEGIVWNAFMETFLEQFTDVSEQNRALEAFYPDVDRDFHGPICARFELNAEHWDLEGNGGIYHLGDPTKAVFGMFNFEAMEKERQGKDDESTLGALQQKLQSLKETPEKAAIFSQRVEMGLKFRKAFDKVVRFLAEHFSEQELACLGRNPFLLRILDLSNRAKYEIVQEALALKKKKE